jgi:hypothetical protein
VGPRKTLKWPIAINPLIIPTSDEQNWLGSMPLAFKRRCVVSFHISANRQVNFNLLFRQLFNFPDHLQECGIRSGFIGHEPLGKKWRGRFKNLTFLPKGNILFSVEISFLRRRGILMNRAKKLTEEEISWLMNVLTPGDCKSCIWREREEEKFRCFPNGDSPCKVFIDKVFQGLESADLI